MEYRYGSHTVFRIQYHFVFVTKYRYKVLKGDVGLKVRELIRQTCEAFEIRIIKGVVSPDHVHILNRVLNLPHNGSLTRIRTLVRYFNPPALAGGCLVSFRGNEKLREQ